MHVIALISQKGGVGKSSLAGHIAVEAERQSDGPVALIDTDPQGSLSSWWNVRQAETPLFVRGDLTRLKAQLEHLAGQGVKLVVIDTPPAITDSIKAVAAVSDLVIIPARPTRGRGHRRSGRDHQEADDFHRERSGEPCAHYGRRGRRIVTTWHRGAGDDLPTDRLRRQHDRRPHG